MCFLVCFPSNVEIVFRKRLAGTKGPRHLFSCWHGLLATIFVSRGFSDVIKVMSLFIILMHENPFSKTSCKQVETDELCLMKKIHICIKAKQTSSVLPLIQSEY